jgi:Lrp/AsnC family transcriptional regulator for asnA, asnC and gidA
VSSVRLDQLDHKIVTVLGKDARVSNRQIAAALGVTEGTIRTRIKRLQNEDLIRFTVVTDFKLVGSPNLVMLGIHADISRVPGLAKALAAIPELGCVMVLLGRYNLLAMGLFTSIEQVNALIRRQIRTLPGVRSVETSTSIRNFKYDARVARITRKKNTPFELDTGEG